jgi:hypothetical protein
MPNNLQFIPETNLKKKITTLSDKPTNRYILKHIARHRKKPQGASIYRDAAIMINR